MQKFIISKTLNVVLVILNVFGKVKSNDYPEFNKFDDYFCFWNGNTETSTRDRKIFLSTKETDNEKIECKIYKSPKFLVRFWTLNKEQLPDTIKDLDLTDSDSSIIIQNIKDDSYVSETRIVTLSGENSKVFFNQSIAYDYEADSSEMYDQYILVPENSEQKVKKLTLIKKAPNSPVETDLIAVFKKDHLDKSRIIAFSAATLEETQINYATAQEVAYDKHRLKSKSGSRHSTAIEEAISRKITELGFQCLEYDDDVMTKSKDTCPTNPQTNHSIKINYRSAERTVTVYSSTFNTSVCYELDWEEFEWKTLWTILIVVIAIVVFVILVVVCWRKKKCCFQESNTAPPSPQGENPMSVARFQNHQSNDRHNGANRPAVEVQADQEDIVLSRVSVGPIDEDEYARENEVQPDHVDEEYVSDSESQKNDGSESQKNDV